jgi:hypothetical protein
VRIIRATAGDAEAARAFFALRHAGLEPFLYADAGMPSEGSPLTVLSMLARLGLDPWARSAQWVGMARPAAIDGLAACLGQIGRGSADATATRAAAERLIGLLPARIGTRASDQAGEARAGLPPNAGPIIILCCMFALGMAFSVLTMRQGPDPAPAPRQDAPTTATR